MKGILFLLLISPAILLHGQIRYLEPVADSVAVETFTYSNKGGDNLEADIYSPAFDSDTSKAVIIYVHGGGFSGGTRNGAEIQKFCTKLAETGYFVVSVSYRLTRKGQPGGFGCDCPAAEKYKTFAVAVEDVRDATFFLIQNRKMFGIDPYKIILSGSSAGAETVLNAAYNPPNCYDLEKGPVSYAGVISMAGAIPDTMAIYKESAVPTLLFHGTCDNLVPYAAASHRHCKKTEPGYLPLFGAYPISLRLRHLGIPYWLYTFCGGAHEIASLPMAQNFEEIKYFCYHFVIRQEKEFRETVIPGGQKKCDYEQFYFCEE